MESKYKDRFEITEMFMAQADHERCFYGVIKRGKDAEGNSHLFSRIVVNDGLIQACASDQMTLGKMLDEMCILVLEYGLHRDAGVFKKLAGNKYFLN